MLKNGQENMPWIIKVYAHLYFQFVTKEIILLYHFSTRH